LASQAPGINPDDLAMSQLIASDPAAGETVDRPGADTLMVQAGTDTLAPAETPAPILDGEPALAADATPPDPAPIAEAGLESEAGAPLAAEAPVVTENPDVAAPDATLPEAAVADALPTLLTETAEPQAEVVIKAPLADGGM